MHKPFSAMILAAGYGKRMLPLTRDIPKPLIEINNVSLLKNCIDLLFKIGCYEIVINTHYKHNLISDFINEFYNNANIKISYEKEILDTAGGVKNAMSLFKDENILITNIDIFWTKENEKDINNFISNFNSKNECRILLVEKEKAHGIYKTVGDFNICNGLVQRYKSNNKILFYSGLQIISLKLLKKYKQKKFSFNLVWNDQIQKNSISANLMNSHCYHVGSIRGLKEAENFIT